ncbi:MAG: hypothetical protein Q9163_003880 [Psora crenata]
MDSRPSLHDKDMPSSGSKGSPGSKASTRKVSQNENTSTYQWNSSHDAGVFGSRKMVLHVDSTMSALLEHEDLDGDGLITVDDPGPKCFSPQTLSSNENQEVHIKGNYSLANLLQELFLAKQDGEEYIELDSDQLTEDPVPRVERFIKRSWWNNLSRTIDASGIAIAAKDPKAEDSQARIYVPRGAPKQHAYYSKIAQEEPSMRLDVQWLPEGELTSEYIHSLDAKPGLLALEMEEDDSETGGLRGLPFIVPGGRFNELYNWDSCLCAWGMLDTHPHIVKSILRHFAFEIQHYGKICNANRSYYLGRAQPPFLTDLALRTYKATQHEPDSKGRLKLAILAAIKEYHNYWMSPSRYDDVTGLARYRPIGAGFPPECEPTQFVHVVAPYAAKYKVTIAQFIKMYNDKEINEPSLDVFCLHDRAVRECGHDSSNRVEGVCADLGTIDLQCLLYKYETDIAHAIRHVFNDHLLVPAAFCASGQAADHVETSAVWAQAAKKRKQVIDKYCWNEEEGLYFDYNIATGQQSDFETATSLWPLWCGVASPQQATRLVEKGLPKFECIGGLSAGTEKSRGLVDHARPQKQWDYPYGWPPHQLLAWDGLKRYGYHGEAERLIYRWLHMVMKVFVDYNGTVVEKYNVTTLDAPHKVDAEYGNQGMNFKYAPQEGWVMPFAPLRLLAVVQLHRLDVLIEYTDLDGRTQALYTGYHSSTHMLSMHWVWAYQKMGNLLSFLPKHKPDSTFEAAEYVFATRMPDINTIIVGIMFNVPSPSGSGRITTADIAKVLQYREPGFWGHVTAELVQNFYDELRNNENHKPSQNPYKFWKLLKLTGGETNSKAYTETVLRMQKHVTAASREIS